MPGVEIQPKRNFDMTWYQGAVLTPAQRARRLLQNWPSGEVTVAGLAAAAGVAVAAVVPLIPLMVRTRLLLPPDAQTAAFLGDPATVGVAVIHRADAAATAAVPA